MTRTGQAAIDYARGRVGPNAMPASGYCLQFVRECFDVASYYGSALAAWNGSPTKHGGDRNPPSAVPLYFATPSQYDHVVFAGDPGEIITTFNADVRRYTSSTTSGAIDAICRDFQGSYLGWCEDINRVTIWAGSGGGGEPGPPIPEDEDDERNNPMQHLMQIDPNVDGRWFLVSYGAGIAQRVWNGMQLDFIRRDPSIDQVAGPQPPDAIAGLEIRGE